MSSSSINRQVITNNGFVSRTRLIHRIIHEYGTYKHGSFTVNLNDLDTCDQRLLLSYVVDAGELEYACETPTRFAAVFNEYRGFMEKIVDAECDEVYRETMEEYRSYRS